MADDDDDDEYDYIADAARVLGENHAQADLCQMKEINEEYRTDQTVQISSSLVCKATSSTNA